MRLSAVCKADKIAVIEGYSTELENTVDMKPIVEKPGESKGQLP